jgi:membrane associated rhomboid family serine protease
MTPTSVGMRCPECARQKTKVRTARAMTNDPTLTYVLIAINVLAFVGGLAGGGDVAQRGGGDIIINGGLFGPSIHTDHEYWRLVTSGFLHSGLLHIGFNMYLLYIMGQQLEPAVGRLRFGLIYFVSLLGGSFGALLVSPDTLTVGASGAVFGLMGATVVTMRARGFNPMQSGIPMLIGFNLVLSVALPGISIGGHIGGLIAGSACAGLIVELGERRRVPAFVPIAGCVLIGIAAVAGSLAAAGGSGL